MSTKLKLKEVKGNHRRINSGKELSIRTCWSASSNVAVPSAIRISSGETGFDNILLGR